MEQEYDYRAYDRIWQKVSPELNPYPEARQAWQAEAEQKEVAGETESAPAAQGNGPCCMGTAAEAQTEVLRGFALEEQRTARRYLRYAKAARRQAERDAYLMLARAEQRHVRTLLASLYLITGTREQLPESAPESLIAEPCKALRAAYHEESCSGYNYARAAQETIDPCLAKVFSDLSADEYRHAEQLLRLLSQRV